MLVWLTLPETLLGSAAAEKGLIVCWRPLAALSGALSDCTDADLEGGCAITCWSGLLRLSASGVDAAVPAELKRTRHAELDMLLVLSPPRLLGLLFIVPRVCT